MTSITSKARRAGVISLLLAITGAFSLFYVSSTFIVPGDATATARNITAAPLMYRVGVLSGLASDVIFLWPLAMGFLRLHSHGTFVAMAFRALWPGPFGLLVIRSGFFPTLLGVLLIVGCFAYLAVSVTSIALPAYSREVSMIAMPFFMVGELSMIVWLLVKGARAQEA